jgi:hypothetical protein
MTVPYDASLLSSLRAATDLSLSDLRDLNTVAISPPRFGACQDELVARQLWREELANITTNLEDRQLARDLDDALRENRSLEAVRREREENEGAEAARMMQSSSKRTHGTESTAERGLSLTAEPFIPSSFFRLPTFPTSEFALSTTATWTSNPDNDCVICGDPSTVFCPNCLLPCRHRACSPCLRELFLFATKDESHNPASCCGQELSSSYCIFSGMSTTERYAYTRSCKEFAIKNRLYCSNKTCSKFLGPADEARRTVTCRGCGTKSCSSCKAEEVRLSAFLSFFSFHKAELCLLRTVNFDACLRRRLGRYGRLETG